MQISGGTTVGEGTQISGVVHVIRDEAEVSRFREGEILVASATSPAWLEIYPLAKAVIAEEDGWLSHAAVVARAYDIPGVINVANATRDLRSGDTISIHADGMIERKVNRREPDSPMRVSVPAAVNARQIELDVANQGNVVALQAKSLPSSANHDDEGPDPEEGLQGNG